MNEKSFKHEEAFADVKSNFIFHEDKVKILFELINKKGIINLGGKNKLSRILEKNNPKIKKKISKNPNKLNSRKILL